MRIFGHDFEAGWPILVIGTLGQLVNCGVGSVGYLLLMSGNERRLMKVQMVMAAVMVVLCAGLVPEWGILGAAVAAAITNAGINLWNLLEVRKVLGLSPYNRSYWRLVPASVATLLATLALRNYSYIFHHDWLAVGITLMSAYCVFAAMIPVAGLDADDRLIAEAIWSRIRGALTRPAGVEA
jgi:O-antigen/teichoic acid export membrane protein